MSKNNNFVINVKKKEIKAHEVKTQRKCVDKETLHLRQEIRQLFTALAN